MSSEINKSKKILLIEESKINQLKMKLAEQGFEVTSMPDPAQFSGNNKVSEIQPDLILIEVDSAGISSFKLCQQIKKDRQLRTIPLIMFSNTPETSNIMKAYKAGADHYVAKTLENNQPLICLIRDIFKHTPLDAST